jgi:hypothetical protein
MGIFTSRIQFQLSSVNSGRLFRYPGWSQTSRPGLSAPDQPHIRSAHAACRTMIPLAAGKAPEDETLLHCGWLKAIASCGRPPGSVTT